MTDPNSQLDAGVGVGQILNDVMWPVLTRNLEDTGVRLNPLSASSVQANTGGQIKRTCQGVVLGQTDLDVIASMNIFTVMVAPTWVLENGDSWQMGAFMFTDDALHQGTYASTLEVTLMDQGYLLAQKRKSAFSVANGGSILSAVTQLIGEVGITNFVLPTSDHLIGDPNSWPPGTTRQTIVDYLAQAAGWLPGYFDNDGTFILRPPPDLNFQTPDHIYTGRRVKYGSPVTHANTFNAPNTIVVIGTGPSKGDISAVAYVDPNLPYSVHNRGGVEVVDVTNMQGLVDTAQAQNIANTKAGSVPGFKGQTFTSPADPRHDLFQTVEYMDGDVYRELQFTINLKPGGFMDHTLTLGGWPSGS